MSSDEREHGNFCRRRDFAARRSTLISAGDRRAPCPRIAPFRARQRVQCGKATRGPLPNARGRLIQERALTLVRRRSVRVRGASEREYVERPETC